MLKLESQFLYREIRSENMKGKKFGRVHGGKRNIPVSTEREFW